MLNCNCNRSCTYLFLGGGDSSDEDVSMFAAICIYKNLFLRHCPLAGSTQWIHTPKCFIALISPYQIYKSISDTKQQTKRIVPFLGATVYPLESVFILHSVLNQPWLLFSTCKCRYRGLWLRNFPLPESPGLRDDIALRQGYTLACRSSWIRTQEGSTQEVI